MQVDAAIIQELWDIFNIYTVDTRVKALGGLRNYDLYYSALDSYQDMDRGFIEMMFPKRKPTLFECMGFLSALVIQQDSIRTLQNIVGIYDEKLNENNVLATQKDLRNRIVSHPVNSTNNKRYTQSFFPIGNIGKNGFTAAIYGDVKDSVVHVDFSNFLNSHREELTPYLFSIRDKAEILEEQMYQIQPYEYRIGGVVQPRPFKPWRTF